MLAATIERKHSKHGSACNLRTLTAEGSLPLSPTVFTSCPPAPFNERDRWSPSTRRLIVVAIVLALAHLPLAVLHGQNLWAREHCQFFPLLLPAAALLGYRRLSGLGSLTAGSSLTSYLLFGFALAALTLAILLFSPWLGAVALQFTLLAGMYSLGGYALVRRLLAVWLLLWLAVPLPGQLDSQLVSSLQKWTSIGASHLLEVLGVLHAREGNVLDVGGRRILVEKACSGVHSLFSVLACTFFWAAWQKRPFLHSLLLLIATLPCVVAGNVLRIVAVATVDGIAGINLSAGWGHEVLGFVLFAGMLVLVWSTDHLLLLLTPLTSFWRKQKLSPRMDARLELNIPSRAPEPGANRPQLPILASTTLGAWPVLGCYGLLAVAGGSLLASQMTRSLPSPATGMLPDATVHAIESFGADQLPEHWGPWQRKAFDVRENSADYEMGRFSRTWHYRAASSSAVAGIYYPFSGWKEVSGCYKALDWSVQDRQIHDADRNSANGPFVTARLFHPVNESFGYLVFQIRAATGYPIHPPEEGIWQFQRHRLPAIRPWRTFFGRDTSGSTVETTYQVQLFVESAIALSSEKEQEAQVLFQQFLRAVATQGVRKEP